VIHFDIDDRYQDELVVGSAISRREGLFWSVVGHVALFVLLLQAARLVMALQQQEPEQQVARVETPDTRVVFMNPLDKPPAPPRERPDLSDVDRRAATRERPETPRNPLPFARGNTPERVEPAPPPEEARAEEATPSPPPPPPEPQPQQPPPPDPLPRPETQVARVSPPPVTTPPRVSEPPRPRNPRALEGAIRNPTPFLSRDAFDNQQGGELDTSSSFQFDSKGVDFGSWLRRFKLQVTANWIPYIPRSAMVNHGHVFLRFYVHKDGTISDVRVVLPSEFDAFTSVAEHAIRGSNPTYALPADYPDEKMQMTVGFFYNERPPD
jgi:TonB family protein